MACGVVQLSRKAPGLLSSATPGRPVGRPRPALLAGAALLAALVASGAAKPARALSGFLPLLALLGVAQLQPRLPVGGRGQPVVNRA
jgi:hypothetical protein